MSSGTVLPPHTLETGSQVLDLLASTGLPLEEVNHELRYSPPPHPRDLVARSWTSWPAPASP